MTDEHGGRRIELRDRRIEADGVPRLVLAGEVHYFRLPVERWRHGIRTLLDSGLDTLATYIPWIWHELPDGSLDLSGRTDPRRNVIAFLDICAEEGADVLARPGPFVMAELENEGIPFRVLREHPEALPVSWDRRRPSTRTVDYLAPGFLGEVGRWYDAILPELAARQAPSGGPVIGVQLDNEIGMLDWVANAPQLTDGALDDLAAWRSRTGRPARDAAATRGGGAGTADEVSIHRELGLASRDRYARYLRHLEGLARAAGIRVPLGVNVHGTSEGRGRTFPIGVSQLAQGFRGRPGMFAGADLYLGDLTVATVADLYLDNAILSCVAGPDQPSATLEFEAGNGDYGDDLEMLVPPEAAALKTVLSLAQGQRLLNYYLLAGGINPELELPVPNGAGRVSFTGERHGIAAPVDPEGRRTPALDALVAVLRDVDAHRGLLASGTEEHDDLVYGFVADSYLTEYAHPDAATRREQVEDLERYRFAGRRDTLGRALVLGGWRFPAVDLQAWADPDSAWAAGASDATGPGSRILVLPSARTLGRAVQTAVAEWVRGGGRLLLVGELPDRDDDGTPCAVLAGALGVADAGRIDERRTPDSDWEPTVILDPSLRPRGETRVAGTQRMRLLGDSSTVLGRERDTGHPVLVETRAGSGRAVVVGADLPVHPETWEAILGRLGVRRGLRHDATLPGVVATTVSGAGGRLLVAVNVAPYGLRPTFEIDGVRIGPVDVPARAHALIPVT